MSFNGFKYACGYRVDMEYLRDFLEEGVEMDIEMNNALAALLLEAWYERRIPENQRRSCPKPLQLITGNAADRNNIQVFLLTRFEMIRRVVDGPKLDEGEVDKEKRQKFVEFAYLFRKKSFDVSKMAFDALEWKTTTN